MTDRRPKLSTFAPAAIAGLLVVLHFMGFGPEPPAPDRKAPAPKAATGPADSLDLDEAKWEAWRMKNRTSIADVGRERMSKEFQQRMRTLGTTPVEVPEGDGDSGGLVVGEGALQLESFLADGGHYSGPLPAHLRRKRAEDGR